MSINHQNLRRLVYFDAIAGAGSIRGAAQRLGLSVPVLSEALSQLEAELNVTLARRSTRHFALTQDGERVRETAQQIIGLAGDLLEPHSKNAVLKGTLHLTLPVELSATWLPSRIASFLEVHPDVRFVVHASDRIETLATTEIELAMRTRYVAAPCPDADPMAFGLALVANRNLADRCSTTSMTLIDSRVGVHIDGYLKSTGELRRIEFARNLRVDNRLAALAMTRAGLGAVLIMRDSAGQLLEDGILGELAPECHFGHIASDWIFRDRMPSRLARAFSAHVSSMG